MRVAVPKIFENFRGSETRLWQNPSTILFNRDGRRRRPRNPSNRSRRICPFGSRERRAKLRRLHDPRSRARALTLSHSVSSSCRCSAAASVFLSFTSHRASHRHKVSQAHGTRFALASTLHPALFLSVRLPPLHSRSTVPDARPSVSLPYALLSLFPSFVQLSSLRTPCPAIVRMS